MTASFTPKSIHEIHFHFCPGCCFTSAIIPQLMDCQQDGKESPLSVQESAWSQSGFFVCVRAVVKDLTKSQENVGLDRSYSGINLKLPLLYASFL